MRQIPSGAAHRRSITFRLKVEVAVAPDGRVPLPAELRYDRTDPYAVRLALGTPSPLCVEWVFARSLLADGLRRSTGSGDVLVIPPRDRRPEAIRVILRSGTGSAVLEIAQSAVAAFLRQTEAVVPQGHEHDHIDLDDLVARLTARGG
ncbi:SsgA family sporulation/cell division regulator [Streptomyces gibsoniae]|uniref:SsgA family sporulation/cell division regulator n=1 Tax=Streptomyces gibsoniae TaxID=3075529 RepID=A0ABU2TM52_9ACTN|nr:SsgA family sporulation/cell division regulator [Streptomyces sp. DSM 41699]MDT0462025.1 SsgA family sporulation/cell division regulator [Streptomyces sp. DSM 41699]